MGPLGADINRRFSRTEKPRQYGRNFRFAFRRTMCDVLFPSEVRLDGCAIQATVIETFGEIPELAMPAR